MNSRPVFIVFALALAMATAPPAPAAPPDRFVHVQVQEAKKDGAQVSVNLPLEVAEKVLPSIDRGPLHRGRVALPPDALAGIDVRTILDSVRSAPDGNFVNVKQGQQNITVTKSRGNLVVHVSDTHPRGQQNVDVTVPFSVVDALFSDAKSGELDVVAALNALDRAGDSLVVNVQDATDHVRVWIDSVSEPQ